MKIALFLIGVFGVIFLLTRKRAIKIPVVKVDPNLVLPKYEERYRLNFSYVTTNTGKDLLLSDYSLYIVRGSDSALKLYSGDCILVDKNITEKTTGYDLYLVNKFPPYSAYHGITVAKKHTIKDEGLIIGAVVSKVQADIMSPCKIW
jgi:hypothetical protein